MTDRLRAGVILAVAVAVLGVVAVATAPGPTLHGDGPLGTLAWQRVAADLGFDVDTGDVPPPTGAFVLTYDVRRSDEAQDVLDWVEGGGRLVLVAPGSSIADELDIIVAGRASSAFSGTTTLTADCEVEELAGVAALTVRADDPLIAARGSATDCLIGVDGLPYLSILPVGQGTVVLLGGRSAIVNEGLREGDNAMFALAVLGDVDHVRFGTPGTIRSTEGLWATLPDAGRAILVAGLLGLLVLVVWAWRRLGVPNDETALSSIGAGTLVDALAGLYRESGDQAHVGRRLQAHLEDLVRRRTGLPPDVTSDTISRVLADIVAQPRATIHDRLTRVPTNEDDLVRLAHELHELTTELEHR